MIYELIGVGLFGSGLGYVIAVARTDRLIAAMTPEQVAALGERVRARRARKR